MIVRVLITTGKYLSLVAASAVALIPLVVVLFASFKTSADKVPIMERLLREEFVKLHTTDLLAAFADEVEKEFGIKISSSEESKRALASIASLASFIRERADPSRLN